MKHYILTSLLLTASFLLQAQSKSTQQLPEFAAKPDSIIHNKNGQYIYVTTDTASDLYTRIIPHPDVTKIKQACEQHVTHIKKTYKQKVRNHKLQDFPRQWNEVHRLKGKFYLYAPSDWLYNSGYFVSDSTLLVVNSDFNLFVTRDFKKENQLFRLETINYSGQVRKIEIKPIKPDVGIYLWTIKTNNTTEDIRLMQDSKYAKKLPMIVNTCVDRKCVDEFMFDDIDFLIIPENSKSKNKN